MMTPNSKISICLILSASICLQLVHATIDSGNIFGSIISSTAVIPEPGCSASVLNSRWLLTAADCSFEPRDAVYIHRHSRPGSYVATHVLQLHRHPEFEDNPITHNIALIQVSAPLKNMEPVRLYTGISPAYGIRILSGGYRYPGRQRLGGEPFFAVENTTVAHTSSIQSCWKENEILPRHIDYLISTGPKSELSGLEGGPMFIDSFDGSLIQVAVHSQGSCGTLIAPHVSWISSLVGSNLQLGNVAPSHKLRSGKSW